MLFVDSRTVEDVKTCVRIVRPETEGSDGVFGQVSRRFSYSGQAYGKGGVSTDYVQALKDVVVLIMIEKKPAGGAPGRDLSVPGIDMVQWGPSDYSMSVGKIGQGGSPEIKAVERKVFEMALRMGVQPRAEIGSVDQAKYYLDMGVRHFNLGYDFYTFREWWRSNGESMRKALEGH